MLLVRLSSHVSGTFKKALRKCIPIQDAVMQKVLQSAVLQMLMEVIQLNFVNYKKCNTNKKTILSCALSTY